MHPPHTPKLINHKCHKYYKQLKNSKYLPGHADEEADLQDSDGDFANRGISFFFKILKS